MVVTKKVGVVAAFVCLTALAIVGCSNSLTGPEAVRHDAQSKTSRDSTGGGTCLSGWIVVDGIATCGGGH